MNGDLETALKEVMEEGFFDKDRIKINSRKT
jgi:hypothetical protein